MVVYTRIHLVIVSIHTPTQGVTTSIMYPAQASQFQSTHPRRVWPFCTFAMCSEYVSIHTPTQGVTIPCPVWRGCIIVSIHTPTQGVTSLQCFWFFHWHVSIHTPTQGVTFDTTSSPNLDFSFNPHTHAGCDGLGESVWVSQQTFQSTHPRRVWLRITLQLDECIWVSIHTPTQGVTPHSRHKSVLMRFNPHTHAGCDKEEESCTDFIGFQSTHPRRVWLYI